MRSTVQIILNWIELAILKWKIIFSKLFATKIPNWSHCYSIFQNSNAFIKVMYSSFSVHIILSLISKQTNYFFKKQANKNSTFNNPRIKQQTRKRVHCEVWTFSFFNSKYDQRWVYWQWLVLGGENTVYKIHWNHKYCQWLPLMHMC